MIMGGWDGRSRISVHRFFRCACMIDSYTYLYRPPELEISGRCEEQTNAQGQSYHRDAKLG